MKKGLQLGESFINKKGNTITIVGIVHIKGVKKYEVTCSFCSLDLELHPDPMYVLSSGFKRGNSPCSCSGKHNYSKYQYEVATNRKAKDNGHTVLMLGEHKGIHTEVELQDKVSREVWNTTLYSYLNHSTKEPSYRRKIQRDNRLQPDDVHITQFLNTGSYKEGTKFFRSEIPHHWCYRCPSCSYDEYVENGLCSGIFSTYHSNLKNGVLSCRCSSKFKWTEDQSKYSVCKLLEEEGHYWNGWNENYYNRHSKFSWECRRGHQCITSVKFFLRGVRCPECAYSNGNGYYPHRKDEDDSLYITKFKQDGGYFKVGRTFREGERFEELENLSGSECDIVLTVKSSHEIIYSLEQQILKSFEPHKYTDNPWSSELLKIECLENVLLFVNNNLNLLK